MYIYIYLPWYNIKMVQLTREEYDLIAKKSRYYRTSKYVN